MSKVEDFLTKSEEQEVVNAICKAEKTTSGEIRVHIEKTTTEPHFDRALAVFQLLEMHKTEKKIGVLIYVAVQDKKFVICGDKGINDVVANDFWDSTKEIMQNHFKNNQFKQGIIEGILMAGEQLKHFFPYTDADSNELSNEISKG